jgi:hypothetical protein
VGCSSGGCGRCSDTGVIGCENAAEGAVEGLSAGLQEKVRAFRRPLHLLLLAEALADQNVEALERWHGAADSTLVLLAHRDKLRFSVKVEGEHFKAEVALTYDP